MSTTPIDRTTAAMIKLEQLTARDGIIEWVTEGKELRRKCRIYTGRNDALARLPVMKQISVERETKRPSPEIRDDICDLNTGQYHQLLDERTMDAIDRFRRQLASLPGAERRYVGDHKNSTKPFARRLSYAVQFNILQLINKPDAMDKLVAAIDQFASDLRESR